MPCVLVLRPRDVWLCGLREMAVAESCLWLWRVGVGCAAGGLWAVGLLARDDVMTACGCGSLVLCRPGPRAPGAGAEPSWMLCDHVT
jgi:hypothetical protein